MTSARRIAYIELLVVSIIWGLASPVIKYTLNDFPPAVFLVYRFGLSSVIAFFYCSTHKKEVEKSASESWLILLYSILAVSIGLGLLFFGMNKTSSLTGTVLHSIAPIMTAIAGAIFLKESITKQEIGGTVLAFLGTLIVLVSPYFTQTNITYTDKFGSLDGNIMVIIALSFDVLAAILVKVLTKNHISSGLLVHISFIIGFFTLLPLALYQHSLTSIYSIFKEASILSHLGVWYMAILSGTVAYILRTNAIKKIEVSETAVFTYLMPVWAAPISIGILKESVNSYFIFGIILISIGVIIAEWKRHRRLKKKVKTKTSRRKR